MHTPDISLPPLPLQENTNNHCFFTYLKIIALPAAVYMYFILGYVGVLDFRVGGHSVVLIGLIFAVALVFARHNGAFGACYFRKHQETFRAELKTYVVKNLMRIGENTKSNASFEDFITAYSQRIRNDNYASVGAGIFPTMGILGTFISIAMTMPDFSSQTADALEQEISLLLTGVGTAFYVSIYGILLSLWWIFFEKRGLSIFDKDIAAIKHESLALFWTKEEIEQAYLRENLQHFEKIGHMFERLSSNDFFERLGKSIEEKFELFDRMLTLEAKSVRMGAEHLKAGMEALTSSQEKQRDLGVLHGHILDAVHQFTLSTNALQEGLFKEREYAAIAQEESAKTFHEGVRLMGEQLEKNASNTEATMSAFTQNFTALLNAFKEEASMYGRDVPKNSEVEALRDNLRMIDAETEQIIKKLDGLR
ncbi:MAG: MotA/TolQ/ExbB proton channel family protein [Campylobacterales bacterium]|nr:MotA/TolQ/ExbB proton channel family protein [Campylobacterales bacterium]